jgi:hypothetical protein
MRKMVADLIVPWGPLILQFNRVAPASLFGSVGTERQPHFALTLASARSCSPNLKGTPKTYNLKEHNI